jgi:hypothetical protein
VKITGVKGKNLVLEDLQMIWMTYD